MPENDTNKVVAGDLKGGLQADHFRREVVVVLVSWLILVHLAKLTLKVVSDALKACSVVNIVVTEMTASSIDPPWMSLSSHFLPFS